MKLKTQISPLSPFLIRIWMPMLLVAFVCLLFYRAAPVYWLSALPLLLVVVFMTTLAEMHKEREAVHVRLLWKSMRIVKADVKSITPSFLDGIGVLRLRRFSFPWGRIYFVADWSGLAHASVGESSTAQATNVKAKSRGRAALEYLAVAICGFLAGQGYRTGIPGLIIDDLPARVVAVTLAAVLFVSFWLIRAKMPSFANGALFVAAAIVALVKW